MGPFCQVDAPPPRPVAGSEDEVLLTAPEIDCSSQITVTEELSFAFSAPETSPGNIRKIKSSVQEVLTLFFDSIRSSRNAIFVCLVCLMKVSLQLTIFIFLSQVSLRSVLGQSQVSLRSP